MTTRDGCRAPACLITGAVGLLGNNLVRHLANQAGAIRVLVPAGGHPLDRPLAGLRVVRWGVNLDDDAGLARAVDGTDVVIHAAPTLDVVTRRVGRLRETIVDGTRRIARAARRAGIRFVHVSTAETLGSARDGSPSDEDTPAGGPPVRPDVLVKREAEAEVLRELDRGLDAVILHPVSMHGPWDWQPARNHLLLEVASGWTAFAPPGGTEFVDARDVAAAIRAVITRGNAGRRYVLGGHRLTHLEARSIAARVVGRRPPLAAAPAVVARAADWCGELLRFRGVGRPTSQRRYSSRRAAEELGYGFRPFEETLRDAWRWLVTRGYAALPRSAA